MSSNDTIKKTLIVAALLCVVCSIVVSTAAVMLKPQQVKNQALDKQRNILSAAGMLEPGKSIDELFKRIEVRVVNIKTGEYLTAETAQTDWEKQIAANPQSYNQRRAAKTPGQNFLLDKDADLASIKRQARYAMVYLAKDEQGNVESIILPVHGYGLWSTLYGFMALKTDTRTVVGFGFYEHAETPGLGGEVDNPAWKSLWKDKLVLNDAMEVDIQVIKGSVDPNSANAKHRVDGLAGATLTSRGVSNLINYWLGDGGFGPYLAKIRAEGV